MQLVADLWEAWGWLVCITAGTALFTWMVCDVIYERREKRSARERYNAAPFAMEPAPFMISFVIARCPAKNRILLGGVGFQGIGEMWFDERDEDKTRTGYQEAEIVDDAPAAPFDEETFMRNVRRRPST